MMTSLRNSPSSRQDRSSLVTWMPPGAGGGGNVINLKLTTFIWCLPLNHKEGRMFWLRENTHCFLTNYLYKLSVPYRTLTRTANKLFLSESSNINDRLEFTYTWKCLIFLGHKKCVSLLQDFTRLFLTFLWEKYHLPPGYQWEKCLRANMSKIFVQTLIENCMMSKNKKIYNLFTYLESDMSFSGHQNTPCKARLH